MRECIDGASPCILRCFRARAPAACGAEFQDMDDRTTTTDFTRTAPGVRPTKVVASKKRRWVGFLVFLLIAVGVGWLIYARQTTQPPARRGEGPPVTVVAVPAATGNIDVNLNALGTVTSLATITVRSQISGQLVRVVYTEGQIVKKGDLLAEIDSRPYELALAQAQGTLERVPARMCSRE